MKKFSFGFAAAMPVALGLACVAQSRAMTLTFAPGVSDTSTSSIAACSSPYTDLNYTGCVTNGFVSDSIANDTQNFMNLGSFGGGGVLGEESFATAFGNTLGAGWSLTEGDASVMAGITLNVTLFKTGAYPAIGGIGRSIDGRGIQISVTGTNSISQSLVNQLVWIQGLEINYTPGSSDSNFNTANNYNVLDDATFNNVTGCTPIPAGSPANVSSGTYCDPIYPFQSQNLSFFDAPMGPWPNGSFRGIALLATIDTVTKTVTTYGGVSYGFDNRVAPEPGTWVLLLAGVAAIFVGRRRVRARS